MRSPKSLSEIDYYCAVIKNFTEEEDVLFSTILDAGFCLEGNFNDLVNHALNIKNFLFFPNIPDAYTLGKKILESNPDGELPPEEDADKVTWLGEYVCSQTCGRFASGCYPIKSDSKKLSLLCLFHAEMVWWCKTPLDSVILSYCLQTLLNSIFFSILKTKCCYLREKRKMGIV